MTDPPAPSRPPAIPSAYNYSWQFDKAMQKPASRLHGEHPVLRRFIIAMIVVGALFAVLMVLMVTGTFRGWRVGSMPWLTTPLFHLLFWPIFAAYLWYIRHKVDPLRHVIRERLCLGCGYSLRGLPVDAEHRGRCPECGRDYSLGEYVHPKTPEKYPLPLDATAPDEPTSPDTDM